MIIEKLKRYAYARDRDVDHEERRITITDDEALELLALLDGLTHESLETREVIHNGDPSAAFKAGRWIRLGDL